MNNIEKLLILLESDKGSIDIIDYSIKDNYLKLEIERRDSKSNYISSNIYYYQFDSSKLKEITNILNSKDSVYRKWTLIKTTSQRIDKSLGENIFNTKE